MDFQVQQVGPSGQMQRSGFGQPPCALFAKICNVFTGECLEGECVLHGPGHRLQAVDFTQGDNLLHMMARVHTAFFKLTVSSPAHWDKG